MRPMSHGSDERRAARGPAPLIACEMCAAVFHREPLNPGEAACCTRCGNHLWRYSRLPLGAWLALALTALIVFLIANAYPIASMSVQGMVRLASLPDALMVTWQRGDRAVAVMCGLAAFALPLLQILLLLWILPPLRQQRVAPGFGPVLRLLALLRPWSMVPVFLLGVLVAVVKLAGMASVSPGAGLVGFALLTVLLTMLGRLSPDAICRLAEENGTLPVHVPRRHEGTVLAGCHVCGQVHTFDAQLAEHGVPCMRCRAGVHRRKPEHVTRTWALLIAAWILYIPANTLPIMQVTAITGSSAHTILGGTLQLWELGSWDLALIVFIASIVVPMTKLLALMGLLVALHRRSPRNLRQRTRLYQAVEFIGQWSMLDVFVVILLSALARFQGLMQVDAGSGAIAFGLVVVLTMLAALSFDPRHGWDAAAQRGPAASRAPET